MVVKEYGYVRVSTKDQNEIRQLKAMEEIGIKEDKIFIDKQSGKDFNRPQYKKMIRKMKANDVLYIKSIDRLGRDYTEIIKQWQFLTSEKNIDIVVLDFPLLNTKNEINNLTGKFISDIVLQILSYVAEVERENIRKRQMEGIIEAKRRGVKFGRREKEIPEDFEKIYKMWSEELISLNKASAILGVDRKTFKKWCKNVE